MTLRPGARVAVIGAGPGGLVAAKHALEAGFDTTVFEASDDLGGQWYTTATHSGAWPGMHTNTSRAMTAFSDYPAPADHPLHPAATQVHAYLRAYAEHFGVTRKIRYDTPVHRVAPAWTVDGEPFDGVVVASGRFRRPRMPPVPDAFRGEVLHAFDYPGAEHFRDRRTLVYGNGVSGLEIAADVAAAAPVVSAFRKPRYVIQKVVDGVSSDWQWYTLFGALQRRLLPREEFSRVLRERVLRVAGDPVDFGAPQPDPDILVAGLSLCQGYLALVGERRILCRPGIDSADRMSVTYSDGTRDRVEAIICATGYDLDLPYLAPEVRHLLGPELDLYHRTLHPDLPGFGVVGQFLLQGPYFPLLELHPAGSWASGRVTSTHRNRRPCDSPWPSRAPRSTSTTRWRRRWPSRSALLRTSVPGSISPSRCCSARCCRRATGSMVRVHALRLPNVSPSSLPRPRVRPWIVATWRRCGASVSPTWPTTSPPTRFPPTPERGAGGRGLHSTTRAGHREAVSKLDCPPLLGLPYW